LLRTERDRQLVQPSLQVLRDAGVAFRQLEPDQARLVEPALDTETPFVAAIQLPEDEVGNCRQFAILLKNAAQRIGVQFRFNTSVRAIGAGPQPTVLVQGESEPTAFDAIVMCAGVASAQLLRPMGIALPLVPVYGYSLSASIKEPLNAPRSAVMDEHYKVAITRLGNRIRIAGGAELGGRLDQKRVAPLRTLYKVLQDWFPGAASRSSGIQEWKGARPMLPDGPPLVCASGVNGIWVNLGHGSSGWALSCGSARALADQIAGQQPDLDMRGFDLTRLLH
jgi:D-amino-acid dehydrogenase